MAKILLVDDDVELTELLAEVLTLEGFDVDVAYNGQEALDKLTETDSYSLVLLDIMMPVMNGIETLKLLRQHSAIPVMMLTARGDEIDRVIGLELGADDYLPKPFHDRELVARIKAILRRSTTQTVTDFQLEEEIQLIQFDGLELNLSHQQVKYKDVPIDLTGSEFTLLQILVQNSGKVVSREELSQKVLGKELSPFDRAVDMHVSNLRHKLPERDGGIPWFKTLRGRGYLFINEG